MWEHVTIHVAVRRRGTCAHTDAHTDVPTWACAQPARPGAQHGTTVCIRAGAADKQQTRLLRKCAVLVLEGRGLERGSDKPEAAQPAREGTPKWDQAPPAAAKTTHQIIICRGRMYDRHTHTSQSLHRGTQAMGSNVAWRKHNRPVTPPPTQGCRESISK